MKKQNNWFRKGSNSEAALFVYTTPNEEQRSRNLLNYMVSTLNGGENCKRVDYIEETCRSLAEWFGKGKDRFFTNI